MTDPGRPRSGVVIVLMIVIGGIMLLPGVCAGVFIVTALQAPGTIMRSGLLGLWSLCFLIAAVGLWLVISGARRIGR